MSTRGGFALLYALFMTMALSVVGLGLMATGTRETMIAAAVEQRARARLLAEAAALDVVAGWSTRHHADMAVGEERESSPAGASGSRSADHRTLVTRLAPDLYLVEADAADPQARARARAGLLVRTFDPSALQGAFTAAVSSSGPVDVAGGAVQGESTCGASGPGILAPEILVSAAAMAAGEPPTVTAMPPSFPRPDPFSSDLAPSVADLTPTVSVVSPAPVTGSAGCVAGPRNWGATDPTHPCHSLLPFISAPGPLRMVGGVGRGVLVVHGDAHLSAGAHFRGIVVVHGRLTMEGGSRVEGAVRARRVRIIHGHVTMSECEAGAALSAPALDRAFRPSSRWWVPVF